jgi:hypothetical protein
VRPTDGDRWGRSADLIRSVCACHGACGSSGVHWSGSRGDRDRTGAGPDQARPRRRADGPGGSGSCRPVLMSLRVVLGVGSARSMIAPRGRSTARSTVTPRTTDEAGKRFGVSRIHGPSQRQWPDSGCHLSPADGPPDQGRHRRLTGDPYDIGREAGMATPIADGEGVTDVPRAHHRLDGRSRTDGRSLAGYQRAPGDAARP